VDGFLFSGTLKRKEVIEMGRIGKQDVKAYEFQGEVVCADCATDDDLKELEEDELITEDHIENSDDLLFCDRCKKQIG
jgi:hypothetical protein